MATLAMGAGHRNFVIIGLDPMIHSGTAMQRPHIRR